MTGDQAIVAEEDSDDEMNTTTSDDVVVKQMLNQKRPKGKMNLAQELSALVTYIQSVPFHGFSVVRRSGEHYIVYIMSMV